MTYEQMAPLLDVKNVDFYSLQLGPPAEQMLAPGARRCAIVLDASMDFYDTAAVVQQLDLVITVDTAVAHLAGARQTGVAFDPARWVLAMAQGPRGQSLVSIDADLPSAGAGRLDGCDGAGGAGHGGGGIISTPNRRTPPRRENAPVVR